MAAATASIVDVATAREGDPCPVTGQPLEAARGIEVGNIFQLGTKYSAAMNANFLDQNGKAHPMIMGCYGIGVGRSMAAVLEQCHDQYGPVWPFAIAPWELHIVALNYNRDEIRAAADDLYEQFLALGIETLLDDRNEKAGFAFADADLMGIPYRLILSPKTLEASEIELKTRDGSRHDKLPLGSIVETVRSLIDQARRDCRLPG
jgi:prolyl-tRNA synthetase